MTVQKQSYLFGMKLRIASLLAALCSSASWANSRGTKSLEQTSPGWTSLTGHTRLITFPVTALANGRQLKLGWLLCVRASPYFSIKYHTGLCCPRREGRGEGFRCIHQFISSLVPRILSHTEVIKYWKYWRRPNTGGVQILEVSKYWRRPMPGNEANANQGWCKPSGVTAW